jgi:hypothetical protein
MVKLHCDRCGEEIKDKYYTINCWEYDTHPKSRDCCMAEAYSSYSRESALEMLNSQKMYCIKCRNEFENFIR